MLILRGTFDGICTGAGWPVHDDDDAGALVFESYTGSVAGDAWLLAGKG